MPAQLARLFEGVTAETMTISSSFRDLPPVSFVNHYDAHIGAGHFLSPYERIAILVMDGRAEKQTGLLAQADGVDIETLEEIRFPHSSGLFYGAMTQFLGFTPDSDEWKVMALASYADGDNEYLDDLGRLVRVSNRGTFELSLECFEFFNQWGAERSPTSSSSASALLVRRARRSPVSTRRWQRQRSACSKMSLLRSCEGCESGRALPT